MEWPECWRTTRHPSRLAGHTGPLAPGRTGRSPPRFSLWKRCRFRGAGHTRRATQWPCSRSRVFWLVVGSVPVNRGTAPLTQRLKLAGKTRPKRSFTRNSRFLTQTICLTRLGPDVEIERLFLPRPPSHYKGHDHDSPLVQDAFLWVGHVGLPSVCSCRCRSDHL